MAAREQLGGHSQSPENKCGAGFFIVVRAETLEQKKLMIPENFVKNFGKQFSDEANIIAPDGRIWELRFKKSENHIFLKGNWTKFAKFYSLAYGHFLSFHYIGFSTFEIHIYGKSGLEIAYVDYPLKKTVSDPTIDSQILSPSFFKVVLTETLQEQTLIIPKRFLENFGDLLSDEALIIAPSGHMWKLGLKKSKDKILFERNWTVFAEHYSLADESFLTFHYKGFSVFHVHIYEKCGCEIAYSSYPLKKNGTCSSRENAETEKDACKDTNVQYQGPAYEGGFKKAGVKDRYTITKSRNFKAKNPNFRVMMHRCDDSSVYVPTRFSKLYMQEADEVFKLQISDGREWIVSIKAVGERFKIGCGWRTFSMENELRKGDICIFELHMNDGFKVSFIRSP